MSEHIAIADAMVDTDLFTEGAWLVLYSSLLADAEYVQIGLKDFAEHSSKILKLLVELQALRRSSSAAGSQK